MTTTLSHKKVILVDSRYPTDGHAPYKVMAEDYCYYVMKLPRNSTDIASIQKEVICNLFIKKWKITTPDFSWLSIPEELKKSLSTGYQHFPVHFGSLFLKNAVDLSEFFSFKQKVNHKQIDNLNDLFLIALFDIWVLNDDRKPSNHNLLMCPYNNRLKLVAIDHAHTFNSFSFKDLNPLFGDGFSYNDSILYSSVGKTCIENLKINEAWYTTMKEKFYFCIQACNTEFTRLLSYFPPELTIDSINSKALQDFLFHEDRNKQVFDLLCFIVNDIKK